MFESIFLTFQLAVTARPGRRDRDGDRGHQLPTAERREVG